MNKLKPGDFIIPESGINVFDNLQKQIGEILELFIEQDKYEITGTEQMMSHNTLYVISGCPSLFDVELKLIFGNYKIESK